MCENIGEVIIKVPYESSGGHGIRFWKRNCDESIREILTSSGSMVIQALIKQHEELNKLHRDSINTIRIMTMTDKNFVLPLSSIVRMGVGGSMVDNISSGGIACGINPDGSLNPRRSAFLILSDHRSPPLLTTSLVSLCAVADSFIFQFIFYCPYTIPSAADTGRKNH